MTATPTFYSPIHALAAAGGASFVDRAGWQAPERYASVAAELAVARDAVALVDRSALGKWRLEGPGAAAALGAADLPIGAGSPGPDAHFRLRDDLFLLFRPPGAPPPAVDPAADATLTDVTHGRAALSLVGPHAARLLSRLCGLDFHPTRFSNLAARQSSVAKTRQTILRDDVGDGTPVFTLVGERSLAAYLWQTILVAGRDLGIAPLGQAAFDTLAAPEM